MPALCPAPAHVDVCLRDAGHPGLCVSPELSADPRMPHPAETAQEALTMPVFTVTFPACAPVTVAAPDPDTAHAMAQTIAPTTSSGLVRDESGRIA